MIEFRSIPALELRAKDEEDERTIGGYGVVYNQWSDDLGGFREQFLPGAFTDSITGDADDIRAINNHTSLYVLGRQSSGTLTLREDDQGVFYEALPPDTTWFRDLVVSIDRGDIRENSFGFWIEDYKMDQEWLEKDGVLWRTVKRARMWELGPQTFPAYPQSDVSVRGDVQVRSRASVLEEARQWIEAQNALRSHGDPDLLRRKAEQDMMAHRV